RHPRPRDALRPVEHVHTEPQAAPERVLGLLHVAEIVREVQHAGHVGLGELHRPAIGDRIGHARVLPHPRAARRPKNFSIVPADGGRVSNDTTTSASVEAAMLTATGIMPHTRYSLCLASPVWR